MKDTLPYPLPDDIADLFLAQGLPLFGSAPASPDPDREEAYRAWIGKGFHGPMEYLERHAPMKYDPGRILPGCRTILCAGLSYYRNREEPGIPGRGLVARYAFGRDYHRVLKGKLVRIRKMLEAAYPGELFRVFTDTAPLDERYYAERAGLGHAGRNGLLITGRYGSWIVLGEILTTLDVRGLRHREETPIGAEKKPCPDGCTACIRACPTGALTAPYGMDASRCISCLTVEHRGNIDPELEEAMGNRIFGCDRCQEVCPANRGKPVTEEPDFLAPVAGDSLPLEEILAMETDEAFLARFAGSPLMRAGRRGMVRNACIAAGNSRLVKFLPLLQKPASDPDPVISDCARRAAAKISGVRPPDQERRTGARDV